MDADWISPAIVAAGIAALVTVLGWFIAYERERRLEAARRREKVRDFMTALRAEIRCHNFRWTAEEARRHSETMQARIRAGEGYTPFVPREADSLIFSAIAPEIHVLPAEAIDPVVRFYALTHVVAQLIEDIRSPAFTALDAERKAAIYADYVAVRVEAGKLAEDAVAALNAWRGAS